MIGMQGPILAEAAELADAQSALAEAERWMAPASREELVRALGELYMRTARRAEGETEQRALLSLYCRELSVYPRDMALNVIRTHRGKFFPTLSELQEAIERDRRLVQRRNVVKALRELLNGEAMTERRISPEERARVSAGFSQLKAHFSRAAS